MAPPPRPPSKLLWAAEYPRALWGVATYLAARRHLAADPPAEGVPVMVLPGLFNSDRSNFALRAYLNGRGHDARGWGLGRNFGARTVGREGERVIEQVAAFAQEVRAPVALVGVSLGGMMARLVAHRRPEIVRRVVTVASPYAGDGRATNVWRAFELITGERLSDPAVRARSAELARPLSMPATAIWSRSDGLVSGMICHAADEPGCEAVEVRSSHLAVQLRPQVLRAVGKALEA